ncbi:MAG: DUF2059 domain-containing protein [Holophagaceae bacterium]|nr:DUF2059 domain-containing protein [Holophagaceae bacterium]
MSIGVASVGLLSGCGKHPVNQNTHFQAALELTKLENGPARTDLIIRLSTDELVKSGSIKPEEESLYKGWYKEVFSDESFLKEITTINMSNYSEKEMRDIISFYNTPSGRRMLQIQPLIAKQANSIYDKNIKKHLPSLTQKFSHSIEKKSDSN